MDLQKQKLKNRLNLRFQPLQNNPSHRYSLKKLSLYKRYLDKSSLNQQDNSNSQLNILSTSRNKSISSVRLPSLQKNVNNGTTNQISPVKKNKQKALLNMLATKQKLIKLNKLEKNQHDNSIVSNAVGNISKINYGGTNFNHIGSNKLITNQSNDVSILSSFEKASNQNVSSNRLSFQSNKNVPTLGNKKLPPSLLDNSKLSFNPTERQKSLNQKTQITESKQKQTTQNRQSQVKVKVQSKASIHETLTFLIKNQILTIPKIVALLQKSHSDQFLYMKVRGIYEYQVCDQTHKGVNFVTVSRNGMVIDGQLISLQKLVHQFQFYKKLRRIPFFKHFLWNKFMNKWSTGSKKALFIQNRNNIYRLLNLDNIKLMKWSIQLKQQLSLSQKGGSLSQKWIFKVTDAIVQKKSKVQERLAQICYQMLYKFDLPISDSTQLMNKVLKDLGALNLNFQTKIRIQKQIQIFYRFARVLQFYFVFSIGQFILRHIEGLCQKIHKNMTQYNSIILQPLSKLQIEQQSYLTKKQQLLVNSPLNYDIEFSMTINQHQETIQISPDAQTIHKSILQSLKDFYALIQRQSFKLVRNQEFKFILNVVNKNVQIAKFSQQRPFTIKDYIYTLGQYTPLLQQLQFQIQQMTIIFQKRIKLNQPFINLFRQLKQKNSKPFSKQCFYVDFQNQFKYINAKKYFCNKLHDGQYFIFGYMDQTQIKNMIFKEIQKYETIIQKFIPKMCDKEKKLLETSVKQHLAVLTLQISTPDIYIQIFNQSEKAEQKLSQYSAKILQLEKISELYYKVYRKQLSSANNQKSLLLQLRSKIKNFKEIKENVYLSYRRQLQLQRKNYIDRIQKLSVRQEDFYVRTEKYTTVQIHQKIKQIIQFLSEIHREIKHFNELEVFYNLKQTFIPKLEILLVEYQTLQQIWRIYKEYQYGYDFNFKKNVFKINAHKQVVTFDNYLRKIQKHIKNIEYFQLCKYLQDKLNIYLDSMQFISEVKFQNLRQEDYIEMNKAVTRQWQKMKKNENLSIQKVLSSALLMLAEKDNNVKFQIQINVKQLTLQKIINEKFYQNKHLLEEITFKCRKELQIKEMINNFQTWWKTLKLQGKPLEEYPLITIFSSNDHVRREIDQYTTILLNILNHKYGTFIRKQCTNYLKNMQNLTQLLRLTIEHQQKFLSLYPILTSKYAQKQLMQQYKKFDQILTKTMKNVRWLIKPTENLNQVTKGMLINHIKHFDSISRYLSDFLEKKRVKFQRFYFLQDNQMLELLVGNQNPNHVFRMFEGIKGWLQDQNGVKVGVIGVGGQQLHLKGWVYKHNEPQLLFRSLEQSIKSNLNSIVRQVLHSYQIQLKELKGLYSKIPWMCIYTIQLILYTKQIQINCFYDNISFEMQKNLIKETLASYTNSPKDNSNYITLLLFLLHFTDQLEKQNVSSVFHFQWYSFLKYYHQHNQVVMRALGAEHSWGGEYQGLWNLMINTSDIRRVNACVLSNLKNANGVLLQGPSGTGKTESLKQLARCMAKHCVVFNCSNQVNIQTLQKLLAGLCYTASWICLDEINRLTAQIMSVIANQINSIKNALLSGKQSFNFMGKRMQIKKGIGVFSTMNPIYLQRAKLTENLKSYFRVISVNAPDYQKILQVMLYSLNFNQATAHSQKIGRLFKNLSLQLGNHLQYDFGMRAMKVFVKKLSKHKSSMKKQQQTIYHALYQTFHSRLDPKDTKTFQKIIKDILGFQLQNYEICQKVQSIRQSTQTGTIILGPTSCKTTIINSYLQSFKQKNVNIQIFNSNSVQPKYFLGQNLLGRWSPGIVQNVARKCLQYDNQMHVLVLDNKLKSEIIQNFNTLLDESKLLTLSNGTRLKVHDNFKLIMETPDLTMTSPATITRCHVIYVSLQDVQKNKIIQSILPRLHSQLSQRISLIFTHFTVQEIITIGKIYPLFWNQSISYIFNKVGKKIIDHSKVMNFTENQVKGLQKAIFYTIQLLNLSNKVKGIMTKQNAIPLKRPAENFFINYQKYQEGQFTQIMNLPKPQNTYFSYFIPTIPSQFCKKVIHSAVQKNESILWYGKSMIGKTTSIKRAISYAIDALFPKQKKLIKVPVDKYLTSRKITQILQQRISIKNSKVNQQLVIYIDNINLCNEQSQQLIRFFSEYGKFFTQKSRQIVQIDKISRIADCNIINKKPNSRMNRHFAQIPFPQLSQNQAADLFAKIIRMNVFQTKTSSYFKQNLQIQLDKMVIFLTDYIKKKNKVFYLKNESQKAQTYFFNGKQSCTYFQLLNSLKTLKMLNQKFVKQPADLFEFLLSQLRRSQMELNQYTKEQNYRILDTLKLCFNQNYKQKFENQYNHSLKNMIGHPKQISFYSSYMSSDLQKVLSWQTFKQKIYTSLNESYYLSEFMIIELIYILRILQYRGGNYVLAGKQGVGKKNIFKMASDISQIKLKSFDTLDQTLISEVYFATLKESFLRGKKIILGIDASSKNFAQFLFFYERLNSGYPLKFLFKGEDIDEAFALMQNFQNSNYQKNIKSYDSIVEDFFKISNQKIYLFISCRRQNLHEIQKNYHYLAKSSTIRLIQDFPSQSIIQISQRILQDKISEKQNAKRLSSTFLKLFTDLTQLVQQNFKSKGYSYFKYNAICHFKFLQKYTQVQKQILQKIKKKQDILNRSIVKIQDTEKSLTKIKTQNITIQEEIKKKQQIFALSAPALEEKKQNFEKIREILDIQRKEVAIKIKEQQQLKNQIELKSLSAQPYLKQAMDSTLSIKRAQIAEFKSTPNIHPLLRFTLQNMIILFGESQTDDNLKKILSDPNLMLRFKNCSPKYEDCQKVKMRVQEKSEWSFQGISKLAFNLRYLYKWIVNILKVGQIRHSVQQKKQVLQKLQKDIREQQRFIEAKYSQLIGIEGELVLSQDKFNLNKNQLLKAQQKLARNTRKLQNADKVKQSLNIYLQNWKQKISKGRQFRKNIQYVSTIYTYFVKIHPILLYEDRKMILQKLQNNLKKALFSIDQNFNAFAYLKEDLQETQNNQQNQEVDDAIQLKQKKINQYYKLSIIPYQDTNNQNIVSLLYHFQSRPILFDPDNQALKWLQSRLNQQRSEQGCPKIVITKSSFTASQKNVQIAIKQGYLLVLLIEDNFDEFTSEILNSKITQSMNRRLIQYNKSLLYIHPNFKLILCNKNRKPNPSVSFFISHQVINFEVTRQFLRNQLLNQILMTEAESVYKSKISLQIEKKNSSQQLSKIQNMILDSLINNKKILVQDDEMINLLQQGQDRTKKLTQTFKLLNQKMNLIQKNTKIYQNICNKGSEIFLSLKYMSRINEFFSWNVEIFIKYFLDSCLNSISSPLLDEIDGNDDFTFADVVTPRVQNFQFDNYIGHGNSRATSALSYVSAVTSKIPFQDRKQDFQQQQQVRQQVRISQSKVSQNKVSKNKLIKFDQIIGAQQMVVQQNKKGTMSKQRQDKVIQKLLFYLKHPYNQNQKKTWALLLSLINCKQNDIKILFSASKQREQLKDYIQGKEITKNMKQIFTKLQKNAIRFVNQVIIHPTPFNKYNDQFSQIQILILCKLMKPQRFNQLVMQLIQLKGYTSILQYEKVDVSDWLAASDNVHPILLMMGQDPLPKLTQFLGTKRYKNVILLAMGQGQSKIAQIVLQKQSKKQNIVIIHNLHISPQFYSFLSKTLQQFQTKKPHINFRLILITSLSEPFDISIASSCHKFLVLQPQGMKNQMKYLYEHFPVQLIEPNHKKIGYSICLLHSVINQLQKYRSQGWNMPYSFNTADFGNSIKILKQIIQSPLNLKNYQCNIDQDQLSQLIQSKIDFDGLRYLIGEVNYVGKLVNQFDRQKMRIFINRFLNPNTLQEGFKFFKMYNMPKKISRQQILNSINQIGENNPKFYGLHQSTKKYAESIQSVLQNLKKCFSNFTQKKSTFTEIKRQLIPQINHKFQFINSQIKFFNQHIAQSSLQNTNQTQKSIINPIHLGDYDLLKLIKADTRIFDLRAFSNPHQFFVQIQKQSAIRFQTQFQKIQLMWSLGPKQNVICYGVKNLKLQGANLTKKQNYFYLDTGKQEFNITLYVYGSPKKKKNDNQTNRNLVKIPLYMKGVRQGQINSYGDNINLLTMITLQSQQQQEEWILRSAAFIADPNNLNG